MRKEICLRCYYIKEGCEIDNDEYYYDECPECGFKYYEEKFCKKCLKTFDYLYEDTEYCQECYKNIEVFYDGSIELETELVLNDNLSIMNEVKKDIFSYNKYIKFHYNNEDYVLCSDLVNLFKYLNRDISKDTFLENSRIRIKPFVRDKRYTYAVFYLDIQEFDFDSVLLDENRVEIKNFKENLKNIIDGNCEKFNNLVKKLTIPDNVLKEVKANLFDIIIYGGASGRFSISKVIINDNYIICWLDTSKWDYYNDEQWHNSRVCVFDVRDGSLLGDKRYLDDYGREDEDIEKYILKNYRAKKFGEETITSDKQFIDYFLTRKIKNPF